MKFVLPCKEYEQKAIEFIEEFYAHSSPINGTGDLDEVLKNGTYSQWLSKIIKDMDIANIPHDRVPSYTYFFVSEETEQIIGMVNIRIALNDFLRNEGGHIGYSIRPTERKKGYGTQILRDTLEFCKLIGICDIIISCDKKNQASAKIIKKCGGILDADPQSNNF